jgi:ABC-type cobalt transport system substrate-binding protein
MDQNEELIEQLKKLNKKLDVFSHPWKNAWYNFSSGIFRSLGYVFGTAIVASIIVYFLSQSQIGKSVSSWIKTNQPINYQISAP